MIRRHGYRQVLEHDLMGAWRTYRLAIVCFLFIVVGIAAPVLTRFLPQITGELGPDEELELPELEVPDVLLVLLPNLVLFGAIAAILLAMGAVASERERGTAALVLSRPVARGAYLWSKLVAIAMLRGLGTGLGVLAAWLYTALLFAPREITPWLQLWFVVWLSTMVYASITLLGSVVAGSPLGAAAVGVGALLLFTIAGQVPWLGPWLPSDLANVAHSVALQEPSPDLHPFRTTVISIGVVVAAFGLAWLRFRRADLST